MIELGQYHEYCFRRCQAERRLTNVSERCGELSTSIYELRRLIEKELNLLWKEIESLKETRKRTKPTTRGE